MEQVIKETVVTRGVVSAKNPSNNEASSYQTTEYLIYFIFGVLEALLAFRLIFKLAGASTNSGFVSFVYGLSGLFIMPFEGIFRRAFAQGVETTAILEPSTIVAILFYALLAWGIVKLVAIFSGERQEK